MTEEEWYEEYKHLEALIDMQKALLGRAADALESGHAGRTGLPYEEKPGCQLCDLIAELRKAATE